MNAIDAAPIATIAAVQGVTLPESGFELALAHCDLIVRPDKHDAVLLSRSCG